MPPLRVGPKSTAVFRRSLFVLAGPAAVTSARVSWSRCLRLSAQQKNAKPMLKRARPGRSRRDDVRRREQDRDLVARMTQAILELFPSCPPEEAQAIAAHTAARGSGRVGRTSAGRAFEPEALTAVVAAIRHNHTRSISYSCVGGAESMPGTLFV